MNQKGFVLPAWFIQFLPHILGGIAFVIAAVVVYQWFDNNWATDAGIEEGRKRAMAEVEPTLAACRLQELAVSDLVKEGEERKARAKDGLQKAQERSRTLEAEAQRLRALASQKQPSEALECPAAHAVKAIREGLTGK